MTATTPLAGKAAIVTGASRGIGAAVARAFDVEEVAAAAVWLCSDQASFVTGATLAIDGGKLAGRPPFSSSGA